MSRTPFRTMLMVAIVFVGTQAASRGEFFWTGNAGPPASNDVSACEVLPGCVDKGCTNVNVVLKIGGMEVVVKSHDKAFLIAHGNCTVTKVAGTCLEYPANSAKCAGLLVYGLDNCGTYLDTYTVYYGNCNP